MRLLDAIIGAKWDLENWISDRWGRLVCDVIGHAKPVQRMWCKTCSRCNIVLPEERLP